jgi:outer membrane protein assembly factor BamD
MMRSVTRSRPGSEIKTDRDAAATSLPATRKPGPTLAALAVCAFLLTGCAGLETDDTANWTPEEHYAEAKAALKDGLYEQAIKYYEKLESRYPYGKYAQQAQIEIAYAYFKSNDAANTIAACDRFIKNHPNHVNVDYVHYLKGLATFNEDLGIIGKISGEDFTDRDPKGMRESYETFRVLVTRFPDSKYAEDSRLRMAYLINSLASNELRVAEYYYNRGAYLAATNRAQYAIKTYPEAVANEQALVMMARAYEKMGKPELRDGALKVLRLNYPANAYLKLAPKPAG